MLKNLNNNNKIIATGRRKSSIATVELVSGSGKFIINNKPGIFYMQENTYLIIQMQSSLDFIQLKNKFDIRINVRGGGLVGQANAIKLAISRALCLVQINYRKSLKLKGFLTRDARVKERKKYGLKKARKAPQFSKR
jgi:small subunit ribosomal protein S9